MGYGIKIIGMILVCVCSSARADIEHDIMSLSGNPRAAIAYLEPIAQNGDANAAYWLARTYHFPSYSGEAMDHPLDESEAKAQAIRWYEFAAQQGHVEAQFELAVYFDGSAGIKNNQTGETTEIPVSAFFVAIGHKPNSEIFNGWLDMDEAGYLITVPGTSRTNIEGVFASGDVQDKIYRQAVTAAGSGCMAALDAERYLGAKGIH